MKDVLNNLDKPWDWSSLSTNKNITIEYILNNPDKPWNSPGCMFIMTFFLSG